MRRSPTAVLLAALLLAPRAAAACSLGAGWDSHLASRDGVSFVAVATSDTVRAGQGRNWHREWRPFGGRSIHGQVVRVERLSPVAEPTLAAAVRRSGGRVVLVPWAHGNTCGRLRWSQSARWLPDTVRGLFVARLRHRAHWAGGLPTFDLDAAGGQHRGVPYTGAPGWARMMGMPDDWLAPDDLLDLLATRATYEELERDPDVAVARLRRWAAAHPALAAREPARMMLATAERLRRDELAERRMLPLAGTWRVTAVLPVVRRSGVARTADTSTFYVRTAGRPAGESAIGVLGVYAPACAAPSERRLLGMRAWLRCRGPLGVGARGFVVVGDSIRLDADGRRHRAGQFDIVAAGVALRPGRDARPTRRALAASGDPERFGLGTFTEWPDGRVTFESQSGPPGWPSGRVTAVRVSTTTLPGG